ncbi:preprotein translocase subunit YajC [Candidatus Sumerlaeota bacterium]|nr:preprotein translocase subunit YajC [Candidatus Sumerlaeota bacterium]
MSDWLQMVLEAAPPEGTPTQPRPPGFGELLPWLALIFFAMYLFILRPQRRDQAQKEKMIRSLEKGDRVITIGGIHGAVASIDETNKTVTIEVGKGVRIDFSRQAIASVEKKRKPAEGGADEASGRK